MPSFFTRSSRLKTDHIGYFYPTTGGYSRYVSDTYLQDFFIKIGEAFRGFVRNTAGDENFILKLEINECMPRVVHLGNKDKYVSSAIICR